MRYLINHVAGASSLVTRLVERDVPGARVVFTDDSATLFETQARIESADEFVFASNVFAVIADTRRAPLEKALKPLTDQLRGTRLPVRPKKGEGFRLMFHLDGQLAPAPPGPRAALERVIATSTGSRVSARGGCQEYWIIGRRESPTLFFAARLPRAGKPAKAKGALSAALAYLLAAESRPHPRDRFLDPFAGSGAIVTARLSWPAAKVIYGDTDLDSLSPSLETLRRNPAVELSAEDALRLPSISDGSIDAIVTDPPWGEYRELDMPQDQFFPAMAESFARVLHPRHGRAVVLTARRSESLVADAFQHAGLPVKDHTAVLVNGHPATVLSAWR